MFGKPIDLAKARILVCNDDGIDAVGIALLEKTARKLCPDVWVVAPETEQSAVSHSLTIRRPLRVRKLGPKRFAVDGTPTDCVMLALQEIMRDAPPTLCLSGINRGGNLADDVTYSGTIAAAMEATILGVPAIALSQVVSGPHPIKWKTAAYFAGDIVKKLASVGWPENVLMNVNFPDVPHAKVRGTVRATQGRYKTSDDIVRNVDPRGQAYYWIGAAVRGHDQRKGTDIWATDRGYNTVTPLHLNLTHRTTFKALARQFGDAA